MRIACISDAVFATPTPDGHGLGRVVSIVAEGLLRRGHDVIMIARPGSSFSGKLVMPNDAIGYEGEVCLAREALRIHNQHPFDCFLDNSHIHHLSRVTSHLPVVSVFHDIYQEYRRCPVLLSQGQQAIMPQQFINARVVYNSLDPKDYAPRFDNIEKPYALVMGLSDIKQPLLAIESCARMGLDLVIAGQSMIGKLPISDASNCKYVGAVSGSYKDQLFQNARVFLQLSKAESFGLTTLEAGLYGCPVVGWPYGGTLDLVRNGVNGILVSATAADKVQAVCDAIQRAWYLPRTVCRAYAETLCNNERQIDLYEQALAACAKGYNW